MTGLVSARASSNKTMSSSLSPLIVHVIVNSPRDVGPFAQ